MDKVKKNYNALAAGAVAVVLGFITKRALNIPSVGASGFESALASFVVVSASVAGVDYLMEEKHGN